MAGDALVTAMDFYFDDKRPVPAPSEPKRGDVLIELPPSIAAKVLLLTCDARAASDAGRAGPPAEYATPRNQPALLTRTRDEIDTIAAALSALGMHLESRATPDITRLANPVVP